MPRYDRPSPMTSRELLEPSSGGAGRVADTAFDAFWRILRRHWMIVVAAIVLTAAVAALYSSTREKQYTATASVLFQTDNDDPLSTGGNSVIDPQRVAATNEQLLALGVVAANTAKRLGNVAASTVAHAVTISSDKESNIVDVKATTSDPALSARIATAYGTAFIALRRQSAQNRIQQALARARTAQAQLTETDRRGETGAALQDRISQLETSQSLQTGGAELVQPAGIPGSPSSPKPLRNGILGAILGAIVGFMIAALLERRDRTVKTVEDLESAFGLPVLARIPRSRALSRGAYGSLGGEDAEAFRLLRASLRFLANEGEPRSLLIASASPGEGKSTIARSLAETMAAMGDAVVLVEADMHRPVTRPGQSADIGLSTVLRRGDDLDDVLIEVPLDPGRSGTALTILPTGPVPSDPSRLLESDRMRHLVRELESRYDVIIIDSPPLPMLSDAIVLANQASGVVAVSAVGRTTQDGVREFLRVIERQRGNLVGVVANFAPRAQRAGGAHYYSTRT
jgi:capsular exopolysaccharide synthesis family protein